MPLERRRHRRGHHLRARARIEGLDLDRRIVDLGQGRERQEAKGDDADEQDRDHQETGRDRTIDEDAGRVHRPAPKRRSLIAPRLASSPRPSPGCWRRRAGRRRALRRCAGRRPALCGLARRRRLAGRSGCVGRGRALARRPPGRGDADDAGRRRGRSGVRSAAALLEPVAGRGLRPGARRTVDDLDLRAVAQTVDAVDHHLVARLEARGDHRALAVARSGDDVALGDRRIVVEEIDEIARRAELDRRVGGERRPGHGVDQKADVDELLRETERRSGLSKVARILIVPVVTSIWLS